MGRGKCGHIAIATTSVDRAVYHLSTKGVQFDEESATYNADGSTGKTPLSGPEDFASLIIWPWNGGLTGTACEPIFMIDNIRAVPVK